MLKIPHIELEKIKWEGIEVALSDLNDQEKVSKMKIIHDYLPTHCVFSKRNGPNSSLYTIAVQHRLIIQPTKTLKLFAKGM